MSSAISHPPRLKLPSPADRPAADVVIFDGDCQICSTQVARLPWWDCQQKLAYLSLHDPEVGKRWPELSHDRLMEEMCIVDASDGRHWGPYAIRYLTRRLRRLWWAAPLLHLPGIMFLAKPAYRWMARNRYRLSDELCADDACQVHR